MPSSVTSNTINNKGNLNANNSTNKIIAPSSGRHPSAADPVCIYSAAVKAIEENDYDELKHVLDLDNLIGILDKENLGNLLLKACEFNTRLAIPMALIEYGSNVNYSSREQSCTSLMMAAKHDNHRLMSLLLKSGAKVNPADKYGWTALFFGSYFGSIECCQLLIDNGAYINLVDCDEMSCLIWASGRGHNQVVELLIEQGAFINASDRYNTSSLIWASRKGKTEIVETLLMNGARINERGMYGWTPLFVAVKGNHLETTRLLLKFKPNLSTCDGDRMSPLMIACKEGFLEIALELIKSGAIANQADKHGNTPLIFASASKLSQVVRELVGAGAYVEHSARDGRNAFHWSVIKNDVESCKLFLELGINLDHSAGLSSSNISSSDESYLALAIKHRSWDVIKLLLEHKAVSGLGTGTNGANDDAALLIATQMRDEQFMEAYMLKQQRQRQQRQLVRKSSSNLLRADGFNYDNVILSSID